MNNFLDHCAAVVFGAGIPLFIGSVVLDLVDWYDETRENLVEWVRQLSDE